MRKEKFQLKQNHMETIKKFHQFVKIERGPINSAIIDLLTGNVFQVSNEVLDKFNAGSYKEIKDFLDVALEEKLVIDIEPFTWVPTIDIEETSVKENETRVGIELHVDGGIHLERILLAFQDHPVFKIIFYGEKFESSIKTDILIELKEKKFGKCIEKATVDGNFCKITESIVNFNKQYNSCWGTVIAITSDGKIRPCIHSQIEVGNIENEIGDIDRLLEKMQPYWKFNKNKVDRCRNCEFRHVCYDCREIAMRKNGEIAGPNPLCNYNPHTGSWEG